MCFAWASSGNAPSEQVDAYDSDGANLFRVSLRRNRLEGLALNDVIAALGRFLLPVVEAAASNSRLRGRWTAGGPWSQEEGA
jgi:hypothetical protein